MRLSGWNADNRARESKNENPKDEQSHSTHHQLTYAPPPDEDYVSTQYIVCDIFYCTNTPFLPFMHRDAGISIVQSFVILSIQSSFKRRVPLYKCPMSTGPIIKRRWWALPFAIPLSRLVIIILLFRAPRLDLLVFVFRAAAWRCEVASG
jgi:hypothetical protein